MNAAESEIDRLAALLDERIRAILSEEEYSVFVNFSTRRRSLPDATATIHEMAVLRRVTNDPEAMRLRAEILRMHA